MMQISPLLEKQINLLLPKVIENQHNVNTVKYTESIMTYGLTNMQHFSTDESQRQKIILQQLNMSFDQVIYLLEYKDNFIVHQQTLISQLQNQLKFYVQPTDSSDSFSSASKRSLSNKPSINILKKCKIVEENYAKEKKDSIANPSETVSIAILTLQSLKNLPITMNSNLEKKISKRQTEMHLMMLLTNSLHHSMIYVLPDFDQFDSIYQCIGNAVQLDPKEIRNTLIINFTNCRNDKNFLDKLYPNKDQKQVYFDLDVAELSNDSNINKVHEASFQVLCDLLNLKLILIKYDDHNKFNSLTAFDAYDQNKHDFHEENSLLIVNYFYNGESMYRKFEPMEIDYDFITELTRIYKA